MKIFKKVFSLLIAVSMLLTSVNVMAGTYSATEVPEVGVIFSDDFEGHRDWWAAMSGDMKDAGYTNAYNWIGSSTTDRGKNGIIYADASDVGSLYSIKNSGTDVDVNSGVLKLSTSYYIPSGKAMPPTTSPYRVYFYTDSLSKNRIYHYSLEIATSWTTSPKFVFGTGLFSGRTPDSNATDVPVVAVDAAFDKWYDIETVIDYEAKTINYFVNGEKVCAMDISEAQFDLYAPVNSLTLAKAGASGTSGDHTAVYVDDYKIEKLGNEFSAMPDGYGKNYIDVKFSSKVSEISAGAIAIKNLADGQNLSVTDIKKASADTLRVYTAENVTAGQMYEVEFVSDVKSLYNASAKIAGGTKLLFTAKEGTVERTLLNYDFENGFDLEAALNSENIELFQNGWYDNADPYFRKDTAATLEESLFLKKSRDGNTYLEFEHDSLQAMRQNVQFNFADGIVAEKGILTTEFDYERAFKTPITDNYNASYADYNALAYPSRGHIGYFDNNITYRAVWDDGRVVISFPEDQLATRKSSYMTKFIHGGAYHSAWNSWGWGLYAGDNANLAVPSGTGEALATTNFGLCQCADKYECTCSGKKVHVKIETDLDNNEYKVYINGTLKGDYDFMPGNINDGIYSAFVLGASAVDQWKLFSEGSYFRIDNLVTTNTYEENYVENIKFTDYEGNETSFATTAKAGTNKITVELTREVDADAFADAISLTGADAKEVTVDGNVATITLANCLTAGTTYTLAVSKSAGIVADFAVMFTTDGGELKYAKPVIYVNDAVMSGTLGIINAEDTVKAVSEIINTTANDADYFIVLAAYNGDILKKIALTNSSLSADGAYRGNAVAEITADADFAGADTVKAFVFNNPTSIIPLTLPEILTK